MTHLQPQTQSHSAVTWRSAGLLAVRYGIGGVMVLGGLVVLLADGGELGWYGFSSAIGAGLSVMLLNLLYRISVSGDQDREREEEARRYFDDHGEWPDEHPKPVSRRQWTLPRGVVSSEQEEHERRHGAANRIPGHLGGQAVSAGRTTQSFPCTRMSRYASYATIAIGFASRDRGTSKLAIHAGD